MPTNSPSSRRRNRAVAVGLALLLGTGAGVFAQAAEVKVAVIDVGRILEDSEAGKAALEELKQMQDGKYQEAEVYQNEIKGLQERISQGSLSLAEEKLEELRGELERKMIALKRFEDDSNRELQQLRARRLGAIEQRIMPVINEVGQEFGYTLIFNKFQSGLVFAQEQVDITELILERFDVAMEPAQE